MLRAVQRMEHWQSRLDELARRHGVPGAVLGISAPEWTGVAPTGVLNVRTEAPVRPDSVFHLGSITKVLVTTAVMRLVQDGRLDLDKPVSAVLPEPDRSGWRGGPPVPHQSIE